MRGYNGVAPLVHGWSAEYTARQLQHLDTLKGFMPPFMGNDAERRDLALWLATLQAAPSGR